MYGTSPIVLTSALLGSVFLSLYLKSPLTRHPPSFSYHFLSYLILSYLVLSYPNPPLHHYNLFSTSLLFSAPLCSAVHPSPLPSPPLHLVSLFYCISSNLTQLSPHQLSSTLVHHSLHHPSCLLCTPSKINYEEVEERWEEM